MNIVMHRGKSTRHRAIVTRVVTVVGPIEKQCRLRSSLCPYARRVMFVQSDPRELELNGIWSTVIPETQVFTSRSLFCTHVWLRLIHADNVWPQNTYTIILFTVAVTDLWRFKANYSRRQYRDCILGDTTVVYAIR